MPEIRDKQPKQKRSPHRPVKTRAQHERFVEREDEVQVRELGEDDALGLRDAEERGAGCLQRHLHVVVLFEVGAEGAGEGGDGLDVEEEELVGQWWWRWS